MFQHEEGWKGLFTRQQAEGAFANGTRIIKANSEAEDATPDGTPGVVLGSISHSEIWNGMICYFVEWADKPRIAMAVMEVKLRETE